MEPWSVLSISCIVACQRGDPSHVIFCLELSSSCIFSSLDGLPLCWRESVWGGGGPWATRGGRGPWAARVLGSESPSNQGDVSAETEPLASEGSLPPVPSLSQFAALRS